MSLRFEGVLYEPDGPIRYVYFPTSAMISLLVVLDEGLVAHVGRVSSEGMVGLAVFLGVPICHTKTFVEIPGEAMRMKAQVFRQELRRAGALSGLLLRNTQALLRHSQRLTACRTWHTFEQRLSRWLLVAHDRVRANHFEFTQEFLSQMLGAHRQSVTLAAGSLQKAGLIRYSRGKLTILDRQRLEAADCDCYRAVKEIYERLFV